MDWFQVHQLLLDKAHQCYLHRNLILHKQLPNNIKGICSRDTCFLLPSTITEGCPGSWTDSAASPSSLKTPPSGGSELFYVSICIELHPTVISGLLSPPSLIMSFRSMLESICLENLNNQKNREYSCNFQNPLHFSLSLSFCEYIVLPMSWFGGWFYTTEESNPTQNSAHEGDTSCMLSMTMKISS